MPPATAAASRRGIDCHDLSGVLRRSLVVLLVLVSFACPAYARPSTETPRAATPGDASSPSPEVLVYRPRYRSVLYLTDLLAPLVSGTFVSQVHHGDAATSTNENELILFKGTATDAALIRQVLPQLDTPLADVMAHGVVYEVQRDRRDASAFDLVLSLLGGAAALDVDAGARVAGGGLLSWRHASLDTVLTALSSDSRFRMVTNPRLRIRSGRSAHFSVGEEVPTLDAITYPTSGNGALQSIKYQSAGVIFDISPVVRDEQIEVQLRQQISEFVATDTGVNDSPTLAKREISTSVVVHDGELIMIGGLQRHRHQRQRHGLSFLPAFMGARTSGDEETEIILLLQVQRIVSPARGLPQ